MLSQLTIQNFGLIDRISIDLDNNLNILTGETGAGKSIIIDALRIALGDRITSSHIRDQKIPCIIEAVFELKGKELLANELFSEFLSEDENTLIIHRSFNESGKKIIKINGFNVTINQLKLIGDHLIDFHGPHDHQMLLSSEYHMGMLDRLVDFDELLREYSGVFEQYQQFKKELDQVQALFISSERELDMLKYQIKELEQVSLDEPEYEELSQKQIMINNAEKLNEHSAMLLELIDGEDSSSSEIIRQAFSPMRTLNAVDEKTLDMMESLDNLQQANEDLAARLHEYISKLSFDPQEAQEVNTKMDIFDDIKRKYGPSLKDAQEFYFKAKEKYDLLNDLEHNDSKLRDEIAKTEKKLKTIADKLSKQRQKTALDLKKTIEKELAELGIKNVIFEGRIEKTEYHSLGNDKVVFYISPNAGEELKPLAQIVSSGEAARVMLALKKALIKVDPVPVLIFDEIDAQIGGRLGTIIGGKLCDISKTRQVILITHLPQIASFANVHYKVNKFVKNGRTYTSVDRLDKKARVAELAQMMSGEQESKIAIKHANDLLAKAGK
ncbi:MAG: DNA repair protein RecN [Omnitrophica WOR_2 bacterium GWF2_38_59]|nr:MAG: DNA repair protein RecN [Omnitrophica WOR_2 bacterium GWF2_38_59]OGX48864.1 MAG: DNA repair protein RecN [Omnitrophica WOR_2 bacterium RIFOXYA2_FULL_38_17]OGX54215.1 MAG: DNA repair protein RecN [Omnitrophica WOR_2 bacterium RIFOXYA12_FULL_38_10]OGX57593.1 MAG: DNA repair protein RecN [Omnitrophica WOR_2 bacterium RIFOXYC2_FULL_38_12]HBG60816.1 DNA repair protein RecN [Candidatus Omnitrophota bacterium]